MNLPDREQEVRRQSDLVKVLVTSVACIAHATCAAQQLANERLNVAGGLARTFMHLAAFEAATAHPMEAEEAEKFGNGCQGVCTSAREELTPAVAACKVLLLHASHVILAVLSKAISWHLQNCLENMVRFRLVVTSSLFKLIHACRSLRSRHACLGGH